MTSFNNGDFETLLYEPRLDGLIVAQTINPSMSSGSLWIAIDEKMTAMIDGHPGMII